jgi:hypothetical protein
LSLALVPAAWLAGYLLVATLEGPWAVRGYPFAVWLTGLAVLSALLLGIGSFSIPLALFVVMLLALAGAWIGTRLHGRPSGVDFQPARDEPPLPEWVLWLLGGAVVGSLVLGFIASLAPVTGWDAAVAHLALPADYVRAGRIHLQDGNVYTAYPHLLHTLYTIAYAGGGERSATLLNWMLGAAACYAIYGLARELAGRHAGLAAAAILATAPIFADQMGSPSIDLAFAAFTTTALWMALRWCRDGDGVALLFAALLAGSSCGIRHTGYLVCLLLGIGILIGSPGARVKAVLLFGVAATVAMFPWMLRTGLLVGNPFFPFFTTWFPASPIDHIDITGLGLHETARFSGLHTVVELLRFPWDIIMRPLEFDGWAKSPGALVLILGVPGMFLAGGPGRGVAGFSVSGGVALFFFQRFARYLLPFFTPMMALAAVAAVRLPRLRRLVLAVLLVHVGYGLLLHAAATYFKVPAAFGMVSQEDYLARRVERMEMFNFANRQLTDGGRILSFDQRTYFLNAPAFQNHWAIKRLATLPPAEQYAWMQEHGIRYVLYPPGYIAESGNIREAAESLLRTWMSDREHYDLVARLDTVNPRGGRDEAIVFRVLAPGGTP